MRPTDQPGHVGLGGQRAESASGTADRIAERIGAAIEAIRPIRERDDDIAVVVLMLL